MHSYICIYVFMHTLFEAIADVSEWCVRACVRILPIRPFRFHRSKRINFWLFAMYFQIDFSLSIYIYVHIERVFFRTVSCFACSSHHRTKGWANLLSRTHGLRINESEYIYIYVSVYACVVQRWWWHVKFKL